VTYFWSSKNFNTCRDCNHYNRWCKIRSCVYICFNCKCVMFTQTINPNDPISLTHIFIHIYIYIDIHKTFKDSQKKISERMYHFWETYREITWHSRSYSFPPNNCINLLREVRFDTCLAKGGSFDMCWELENGLLGKLGEKCRQRRILGDLFHSSCVMKFTTIWREVHDSR